MQPIEDDIRAEDKRIREARARNHEARAPIPTAQSMRSYQAQRTEEAKTQQREDAHRISYQENTDPNEYY